MSKDSRAPTQAVRRERYRERYLVLAFSAFAALRVLICGAVFPFFNNVDETSHYDLVVKYSHGEVPRSLGTYAREVVLAGAKYQSPEYMHTLEEYGGRFPDPPKLDGTSTRELQVALWALGYVNGESGEPPFYYALAGLWLRLGQALGLAGYHALFWIRWFAVLPAALLVWLGHVTARAAFPESRVQRLGVPLLLAVFPQDTFYAITADVLSPLCFGLGFLGALRFASSEGRTPAAATRTGLALAASVLTKTANLPLVGVTCAALALRGRKLTRESGARSVLAALALLFACVALPILVWMISNELRLGDWLGTAQKIKLLDWTPKPPWAWLPHPLFSGAGPSSFWPELLASFWRGELVWHRERMAHPGMDVFYWASSAVFPLVALIRLPAAREARDALVLAAFCFASGIAFQAVLSVAFDFGRCYYPSRALPFFTSGRLLSGALIPFLLLYVHGIDRSLAFTANERVRWLALGGIATAVTVSELWLDLGPMASAYNFFHLGG